MDHTLTPVILPMLKQLRDTKHGSPHVDPDDLPDHLRKAAHEDWSRQMEFEFEDHEDYRDKSWSITEHQWNWVMDEMIFAFERLHDDTWEDEFRSGVIDHKSVPCKWDENGKPTLYTFENGPNHTYECDYEGCRIFMTSCRVGTFVPEPTFWTLAAPMALARASLVRACAYFVSCNMERTMAVVVLLRR